MVSFMGEIADKRSSVNATHIICPESTGNAGDSYPAPSALPE